MLLHLPFSTQASHFCVFVVLSLSLPASQCLQYSKAGRDTMTFMLQIIKALYSYEARQLPHFDHKLLYHSCVFLLMPHFPHKVDFIFIDLFRSSSLGLSLWLYGREVKLTCHQEFCQSEVCNALIFWCAFPYSLLCRTISFVWMIFILFLFPYWDRECSCITISVRILLSYVFSLYSSRLQYSFCIPDIPYAYSHSSSPLCCVYFSVSFLIVF